MNTISNDAEQRREAARAGNGTFGEQIHTPAAIELTPATGINETAAKLTLANLTARSIRDATLKLNPAAVKVSLYDNSDPGDGADLVAQYAHDGNEKPIVSFMEDDPDNLPAGFDRLYNLRWAIGGEVRRVNEAQGTYELVFADVEGGPVADEEYATAVANFEAAERDVFTGASAELKETLLARHPNAVKLVIEDHNDDPSGGPYLQPVKLLDVDGNEIDDFDDEDEDIHDLVLDLDRNLSAVIDGKDRHGDPTYALNLR
ncbi:hypothetical protein ACFVAJ_16685 [Agromyces sp. NPDC057679]|uniref:hypothetical protein n=1 Tax=Agromyces sp. NPDC057679 TaxID=3346207 RepID=UPI0036702F70